MKLRQPVFDVGEQEMTHLLLAVVEQLRVPVRMIAGFAGRRIEVIRAVELV